MTRKQLRQRVKDLEVWELDKLADWYRQTGDDVKKSIIKREQNQRAGKIDGQISLYA